MPPLVVIVGETASGKTALALALAKKLDGEIIAADSRTVYAGMDIGTAKPTPSERQGVPHYGLDVANPGKQFSAYDFQQLAQSAITSIAAHGRLPIMVGGTGLYIDAVLYDFTFRPKPSSKTRAAVQGLSVEELQARLLAAKIPLPENRANPRHLARLLESGAPPRQRKILRKNTIVLGLSLPLEELQSRIVRRVDAMVEAGLIDEVRGLLERYGNPEALRAPGYKAFAAYIQNGISLEEAKRQFVRDDLRLAKRQRTWFRRNKDIHWLAGDDIVAQAVELITPLINR